MASTAIALQRIFFSQPFFAVVGASKGSRTSQFGNKLLKWYQEREFLVQPMHPKDSEVEGMSTLHSIKQLPAPASTSISVATPPKVTLEILKQAKALAIPSVWLQPGSEDAEVIDYIQKNGMSDAVVFGGPCVLRDGDKARRLLF
ncbi:NAD-P-bindingprotein [Moniliophthora roreri MCA 2997]|uniref:NAD-P-bindingprotein n=2 Tax=Moniliophthora roreri TaxID=221103 RepID=V2WVI6_MONRO|nr:NAD-P-bindingprotein [Moniliophthora roreri MCA 2997]